ncbi:Rec8 like protein-domain-containing protein [Clohesyomyces aquaticus]|uniref:Rec8 like protein-domain-containing protein n=1 Tax=Clohesyomyces aquaticus TaxID=1231657 RepID=A0A1Y2A8L4_9PLEO|nr:Rec8 like protein-domain-containing protein [Clohesyomyces aquaticus]
MFYSHDVLTSRKYGVATVWLVATLGAKSNLRKINRKAILDVDVPKACQTIIDPAAPMALRLQGNLLYGVSRVYLQQCGYVLSDAQNAHNAIRLMLKAMQDAGLDPEAGKARPEQLVLQDDPSFLPDFALLPPADLLADLQIPLVQTPRSGESQSLTPFGSQQAPGTPGEQLGGLVIPSSSSRGAGGFALAGDDGGVSSMMGDHSGMLEEEGIVPLLDDPDFGFDADGNLIEFTPGQPVPGTPAVAGGATVTSDAGASARVRREHEEGQRAGVELHDGDMDIDLPLFGDDLSEGEAFPANRPVQGQEQSVLVETSSTVAAPMRRKRRTARVLSLDTTMELRNKDLSNWNTNYLKNMEQASRVKHKQWVASQAKKNAEYWVWGAGLGGIGNRLAGATGPTPFDNFYGDGLFKLLTGQSRKSRAGKKHDRDSGIDEETQGESRRVRPKSDEDQEQIGRGEEDEAMFVPGGDEEVELPRDAPSALDDQQVFSAMPWNMSASRHGSSALPLSGRVGMLGSMGRPSSLSMGRGRGSRMVSASPLHGHGKTGAGGLEALRSLEGEDELGNIVSDDFGFAPLGPGTDSDESFEQQPFQPSVRVHGALSAEGGNFLAFVADAIAEKRQRAKAALGEMADEQRAEAAEGIDEVLFEEFLSPTENTKMVAAQGLLMVLALGTKGLLNVRQDDGFEEIGLSLTKEALALQTAVQEHVEEEADVEKGEGQFEEQLAMGAEIEVDDDAESEEAGDDHDSLYTD